MKVKTVPSEWIRREGRRMDCNPYLSGALEAKIRLEELSCRKDALKELTSGHAGGIYNGPQFTRNFVDSPKHGVPFLGTSSMLRADLSVLPLLRKKDAHSPKLSYLRVRPGMTLISCSGTIGRMIYARPDMDGAWSNQDILKVVANTEKVPSGYLYAYLNSKFGVPLVVSGTYGAIIQHIEPQHIADLPVPRLGYAVEKRAHELVEEAARKRTDAAAIISSAAQNVIERLEIPKMGNPNVVAFGHAAVQFSMLNRRLDAPYHSSAGIRAQNAIQAGNAPVEQLTSVVNRYFKPPMFKRLWVEDPAFGRQFISGVDAYRYQAESIRYVSKKTPRFDEFIIKKGWVVFQAAGQIYGLFGQPLYVNGWLEDLFCADDMYRLVPHTESDGAYIYAFFRTPHGEALLKRQASGNSIPRVWDPHMRDIQIPWPSERVRQAIAAPIIQAHEAIEAARIAENKAVALVECAIEEAS